MSPLPGDYIVVDNKQAAQLFRSLALYLLWRNSTPLRRVIGYNLEWRFLVQVPVFVGYRLLGGK